MNIDILNMSMLAGLLIILIYSIRFVTLHKIPKTTFLILWGIVLLRMLVPVSIPVTLPTIQLPTHAEPVAVQQVFIPEVRIIENTPTLQATQTAPFAPASPTLTPFYGHTNQLTAYANYPLPSTNRLPWALIIWLTGSFSLFVFLAVIYFKSHRELRYAALIQGNAFIQQWLEEHKLVRTICVLQSDRITTPLAVGILNPRIILPATMDLTNIQLLQHVLLHEYHHIRRFDAVWKLLMAAALCLHWFNPLAWLMFVLANRDLEITCDELVVKRLNKYKDTRASYAYSIINMAEQQSKFALLNSFSKNAAKERIESVMKIKKSSVTGVLLAGVLVVGSACGVMLTAVEYTPIAPPPPATAVATANTTTTTRTLPTNVLETFEAWGREVRFFDDVMDQVYYNQFGNGFEYMRRHSVPLGYTAMSGDFEIRMLYAVAVSGQLQPGLGWNAETLTAYPDWEQAFRQGQAHVFFSVQDTTGSLGRMESPVITTSDNQPVLVLLYHDDETNTGYFVSQSWLHDNAGTFELAINFDNLIADHQVTENVVTLNLSEILENHEASFVIEDRDVIAGWGVGWRAHEMFGDDFIERDQETLTRNELNIPIAEGRYLTNIGLREDFLFIQVRETLDTGNLSIGRMPDRSVWMNFFDVILGEPLLQLYDVLVREDLRLLDAVVLEQAYQYTNFVFLYEPGLLDRIAFNFSESMFNTIIPLSFNQNISIPINVDYTLISESPQVNIAGHPFMLKDINVSPLGLHFVIEDGMILNEIAATTPIPYVPGRSPQRSENDTWFDIREHLQATVIVVNEDDAEESNLPLGNAFWNIAWDAFDQTPDQDPTDMEVRFQGDAIDLDNVVVIRINGVDVDLR